MTVQNFSTDHFRAAVAGKIPAALDALCELVRIPSVSWDGFDPSNVQRSADSVKERMSRLGIFDDVTIVREPISFDGGLGQPAVLARREAKAGYPTVLLYAHHDVQPPGNTDDWLSEPFEPEIRDGRVYGRGAADDKAGVLVHATALETIAEAFGSDLNIGLALFIEGEEEFGSRSFTTILERHEQMLKADIIVVADSDNRSVDIPSLTVSLRGNVTFAVTVSTLSHASHSGMLGGAVPDAMMAAMTLVARMYRDDGGLAIEGLNAHTAPVPEFSREELVHDSGLLDGVSDIGKGPILSRLWFQPAVTVTGIDAPTVVNASNTIVPKVTIKISVRVAPGQSAASAWDAVRAHLEATAPWGAHLEFGDVDLGDGFLVDTAGSAVASELDALRDAWDGADPVLAGVGGSIPFISELATRFPDAQILVTGVEDPASRAHSPNESLSISVFERAILAEVLLLARLNVGEA
jgi:acetylornithine deacetylase/succinyl-diaminopimelate desuccinylase-like protein